MKKVNQGLYDPKFEHDACGIGFVANLKNKKSHETVEQALLMLSRMEHRGACGCETNTGDGAGILIQVPHKFFQKVTKDLGFQLPDFGQYGVGQVFFPTDKTREDFCKKVIKDALDKFGIEILGYRKVPKDNSMIGPSSKAVEPTVEQLFVAKPATMNEDEFERKLYIVRNYSSHIVHKELEDSEDEFYYTTFSYKTIVYKGQLTTEQVGQLYVDLKDKDVESALAVVHSRFSTNTFPKWKLAQPFRYIAHNGEINTVRGNVNWMAAREAILTSEYFTAEELEMIKPVCDHAQSDSANLDNAVELLLHSGRSLPHVMMMLIPEAWDGNDHIEDYKKEFYEYHSTIMEPWDGPASISFTDGKIVGATLDRNGLRPSRYLLTDDDMLIMASEAGVLRVDPAKVVLRGRLQPGKIFVADLEQGRIISDEELKKDICTREPYGKWLKENKIHIADLAEQKADETFDDELLLNRQQAFGYSSEDLKTVIGPLARLANEPLGSMGTDAALPILSDQAQHISNYFKQLFAQVTNPPIDPIREKMVMSLVTYVGKSHNINKVGPEHCSKIQLSHPILTNNYLAKLKKINHKGYDSKVIDITFPTSDENGVLEKEIDRVCAEAVQAVKDGVNILILSDKAVSSQRVPIPALMATGAVHHALIGAGKRASAGIVVESGDIRETHHIATLVGYGAEAVNPYLAFETIKGLNRSGLIPGGKSDEDLIQGFIKGGSYGLRKIFSKMGISTLQSYHGAQIFEALGIANEVVDKCFIGTTSRVGGMTFDGLAQEALIKHSLAFPKDKETINKKLEVGGFYQWKRRGEFHLFNPTSIHYLQHASKTDDYQVYKKYAREINNQTEKAATLRGLLEFTNKSPIPLSEVEPVENIFKRFATGAMSFGSISHEAHSTLAIAMNRIGGKSNSGEGGEDPSRFYKKPNGDWERSAIKQVASGRFGVTSYYLSNADEIQIKMAQGAKPGEGGQLPGHKVDDWIGRVRHSTPGVGLISPPPHHDIYSIEDLSQLIFDLKNANRKARINVKLVSEAGVGTIAAGVCKGKADVVLIAGHDGGTGASPLTSIRHAGLPWELGLAETHQTLVKNKLRSRIVVQADGQMKTGRDLAIAALLGAEEWGVATAALVVEGCIIMRKCHLNTCPVGIATQNKALRKRFAASPDHVVNFFKFLAEDLREIMADLGFRSVEEMVGQADKLKMREDISHWKYNKLDLSKILYKEENPEGETYYNSISQDHELENVLDWKFVEEAQEALVNSKNVKGEFEIVSTDRAAGTILGNELTKRYKAEGLPEDTIRYKIHGSAGQSFGAFTPKGITFDIEGEANDYFGKGLSGSKLILKPYKGTTYEPSKNIIVGNVAFYGATAGEAYIRGIGGERFCVRNSGAKTVIEGIGDHGCEYMTGGTVVILGSTGRNFAAGMSGGMAFIYDEEGDFKSKVNMEMIGFDALEKLDYEELRRLITNHFINTKSDVAEKILTNWDEEIQKFVKVMPKDYKRVMLKNKLKSIESKGKEVEAHG